MTSDYIIISANDTELYSLVKLAQNNVDTQKRLLKYAKKLLKEE